MPVSTKASGSMWSGSIDLHQGDTGTISFKRVGDTIDGSMRVTRGESVWDHAIDGVWEDDTVRFTRHLDASSIQPFEGTVVQVSADDVRMEGNFAAGLRGTWTAECHRSAGADRTLGGPALTIRIKPFKPTQRDRIEFHATASHSSGVRDITHHVNGSPARTCAGDRCVHVDGPFPAGSIMWRVSARSVAGGETEGTERAIEIAPLATGGNCRIIARVSGPRADSARAFSVSLFGPGNLADHRTTRPFDANGRVEFSDLPEGRYRIVADARGDIAVDVSPRRQDLQCSDREVEEVVFHLQ